MFFCVSDKFMCVVTLSSVGHRMRRKSRTVPNMEAPMGWWDQKDLFCLHLNWFYSGRKSLGRRRITLHPRFIYCANIEFTFGWSSSWEGNWMLFALLPLTQRSRRPLNRRRRLHEHVVGLAFFQLLALAAFFLFRRWVSCFILGNRRT